MAVLQLSHRKPLMLLRQLKMPKLEQHLKPQLLVVAVPTADSAEDMAVVMADVLVANT